MAAAAAATGGNPKGLYQDELQTFAAGAPAQGPYQSGLQTPDLMSYIDVAVLQQLQPVISPHLLAAPALSDESKRIRESYLFPTSFENLAAADQASSFLKIADAISEGFKVEVKKGKLKGKAAGAPRSVPPGAPGPPATGPPSNLGTAKRKGGQAETTEDARTCTPQLWHSFGWVLESKRDRNRLAAVSFLFLFLFFSSSSYFYNAKFDIVVGFDWAGVAESTV